MTCSTYNDYSTSQSTRPFAFGECSPLLEPVIDRHRCRLRIQLHPHAEVWFGLKAWDQNREVRIREQCHGPGVFLWWPIVGTVCMPSQSFSHSVSQ